MRSDGIDTKVERDQIHPLECAVEAVVGGNIKPSSTIPNRKVRHENLRAVCDGFALAIVTDSSLARRRGRREPVLADAANIHHALVCACA